MILFFGSSNLSNISYHIYHPIKTSIYLDPPVAVVPPVAPGYVEGTFTVLSPRSVAYLDFTGSGSETIAHSMQQLGSENQGRNVWKTMGDNWENEDSWSELNGKNAKTLVGTTRFLEGTKLVGLVLKTLKLDMLWQHLGGHIGPSQVSSGAMLKNCLLGRMVTQVWSHDMHAQQLSTVPMFVPKGI